MNKEISQAVKTITDEIAKDPGLRLAYQANIAMAFQDMYFKRSAVSKDHSKQWINQIANEAANEFLCNWCGTTFEVIE